MRQHHAYRLSRLFTIISLTLFLAALSVINGTNALATPAERDAALELLTEKSSKKRATGIDVLAASGDPAAAPILAAMADGDLYFQKTDNRVVIAKKQNDGYAIVDPISNEVLGVLPSSDLKKIRVNNRLRRQIRGVLGGLNLSHPNAEKRLVAASGLQKSPDPALRPALKKAFAAEADEDVKAAMAIALAVIDSKPEAAPEDRLAAIELLTDSDATEARIILTQLASDTEKDASIRAAATVALDTVEDRLFYYQALGSIFQGLSLGSVLLLAAIGLAITFGVMGVINMAHGEMVMIGAYVTFMIQEVFRSVAPEYFGLSLALAVPAAFLASGGLGVIMERSIIRWLYGRPLETLLATWGISLILQQAVRTIFGPTNREVGNPEWMSGAVELAGGVLLTYNRIWMIVFALAVLAGVWALIRFTSMGLEMRAVTQNRRMANSMGLSLIHI